MSALCLVSVNVFFGKRGKLSGLQKMFSQITVKPNKQEKAEQSRASLSAALECLVEGKSVNVWMA